jgi:hypothetical protein
MVTLNFFVELIFTIVQLLTNRAFRESPHGSVTTNLMSIWNQLNGCQGLLWSLLMIMNMLVIAIGNLMPLLD